MTIGKVLNDSITSQDLKIPTMDDGSLTPTTFENFKNFINESVESGSGFHIQFVQHIL